MELRVGGSRGAVDEAGGDEPIGVDLQDTVVAAAGERRVLVDERERRGDRCLVRGEDLIGSLLVRDRPQRRDTLRWGEREGEARDCALVVGIEAAPERSAVARIGAVAEETLERERVSLSARDPERLCAATDEAAGRSALSA